MAFQEVSEDFTDRAEAFTWPCGQRFASLKIMKKLSYVVEKPDSVGIACIASSGVVHSGQSTFSK